MTASRKDYKTYQITEVNRRQAPPATTQPEASERPAAVAQRRIVARYAGELHLPCAPAVRKEANFPASRTRNRFGHSMREPLYGVSRRFPAKNDTPKPDL